MGTSSSNSKQLDRQQSSSDSVSDVSYARVTTNSEREETDYFQFQESSSAKKETKTDESNNAVLIQEKTQEETIHNSDGSSRSPFGKFVDSFKRVDEKQTTSDLESGLGEVPGENSDLKQTIKKRHVLLISLGTGIGTGLLVGNAKVLRDAGPGGLVIGYSIMGSCLYCIIQACGELAVCYSSLPSNFNIYPTFLVDKAFGFAVAWVYCLQWLCVCPLELVTASMTIKYWTTSVNPDIFVSIFFVLIIVINTFGARGYAEAEFFFNSCKVLMMAGFFILGIIITCGGAGTSGYIGAKYWHSPGAFNGNRPIDHFKGVMATFTTAAFAFGASEFISLTAAEQSNPRKAIPKAAKMMIYRILFVFLSSITLIGFLVPYNSPYLLGSGSDATKASPYVVAVASHGVRVVPHFINAVILLSVLSVGNSAFYSSSRLLNSLAQQGYAPKMFTYIDKRGRPLVAMVCSTLFMTIAFCAASPKEEQVFTWLLAISGLSQLFTWVAICISHLRFRRALKVQGHSLGEIGFKSQVGIYGSLYAATMLILALIAQFWVALAPIGGNGLDARNFFQNYLAMPILLVLYFGYKIRKRDWKFWIPAHRIDLVSHRKVFDEDILKQEVAEIEQEKKNLSTGRKIQEFFF
ncbi:amino acid permease KNAG_0F00270 [Huiozyma naganishii CBS 8797]|uniref:Amino acid permease/ SLC12A domain-containing protein n=1 Tax=Huiozyma naganishii (strain ATCC MYA-139 / BCRC 22969 / CBS 8797 / KCTC 17520 / NBRC 10181 / NCYC 3082 / Yp74L-3) TaxID=1071383 RepID=J7S706_HUIN7|nr:hypothetical protein KNAG_0F00270 [Kazachstania naganishii CBS 8797]CCK70699.1 hypothetical protein KNAG_0F00270 [Kazachstania naganishii CBS 8797]